MRMLFLCCMRAAATRKGKLMPGRSLAELAGGPRLTITCARELRCAAKLPDPGAMLYRTPLTHPFSQRICFVDLPNSKFYGACLQLSHHADILVVFPALLYGISDPLRIFSSVVFVKIRGFHVRR